MQTIAEDRTAETTWLAGCVLVWTDIALSMCHLAGLVCPILASSALRARIEMHFVLLELLCD